MNSLTRLTELHLSFIIDLIIIYFPCFTAEYDNYIQHIILLGVNTEDGRSRLLQSIQSIRQLNHLYIHTVWGACLEGSPNTPEGVEILVATGCTHFHVNLYRLLRWTRENNSQVRTGIKFLVCTHYSLYYQS